ncbi:MAG: nucleoside phosphorylase [Faecalibacterium sp.]|nr:nucleoside phosphorylase [Faecalibacterium sp.]
MIIEHNYPICEFDPDRNALIRAADFLPQTLPKRCVITFFRKELEQLVAEQKLPLIGRLHSEVVDLPIYGCEVQGEPICIALPFSTAPGAAATIEELHAMGCERFVVCGGAGALKNDTAVGTIIVPTAAVRDEGTSYHYLPPSREVECDGACVQKILNALHQRGVPNLAGKTWTTDAFYRETPAMIDRRRREGCLTVEMEAAAFFAVSQYYGLPLAQLLYAGDDVSGPLWDSRGWNQQKSVRANLLQLTMQLAVEL